MYYRVIHSYVHQHRIGVMLDVAFESDYATRTAEAEELIHNLALHIVALQPQSIDDLLGQGFVKDPTTTVGDLIETCSTRLRERIIVRRFIRWDTESLPRHNPEPPKAPAVIMKANRVG